MEILKMFCYAAWGIAGLVYTAWLLTGIVNGNKLNKKLLSEEDEA